MAVGLKEKNTKAKPKNLDPGLGKGGQVPGEPNARQQLGEKPKTQKIDLTSNNYNASLDEAINLSMNAKDGGPRGKGGA